MDGLLAGKGLFRRNISCDDCDYRLWFSKVFGFKAQFYFTDKHLRGIYLNYKERDYVMPEWLVMLQRLVLDIATREDMLYYLLIFDDYSSLEGYSDRFLKDMVLESIVKDLRSQNIS